MDSTLATLLFNVRSCGSIPAHSGTGSQDSDLISYLNYNLIGVAAEVIKCREGFYRTTKDYTLNSNGTLRYRIPTRAIGNRLAAVLLLDGMGNTLVKLDEISYSRMSEFRGAVGCYGYHLEAGDLVLLPGVPTNGATTLRMIYYLRPGALTQSLDTASGNCFTVTGVSGNVISIMSGHGLTTSTKIDIVKKEPPCETLTVDELPSATGATTVTVADGSRVEIGDFVCKADFSPKPQCPDAFYAVLAAMSAQDFWTALGSEADVNRMERIIYGKDGRGGLMGDAVNLIAPRVEENSRKIISAFGAIGAVSPGYRWRRY